MAIRLSELLDRIRPAGAPGAPTDAEPRRDLAASEETAHLVRLLEGFEAEADELVAQATRDADEIRAEGERTAGVLRAELPERVAAASAEIVGAVEHDETASVATVTEQADAQVAALRRGADLDRVAAQVVDVIWSAIEEGRP